MRFDPNKKVVLEMDFSDFVFGEVIFQYDENGTFRPVIYFSKKTRTGQMQLRNLWQEIDNYNQMFRGLETKVRGLWFFYWNTEWS